MKNIKPFILLASLRNLKSIKLSISIPNNKLLLKSNLLISPIHHLNYKNKPKSID